MMFTKLETYFKLQSELTVILKGRKQSSQNSPGSSGLGWTHACPAHCEGEGQCFLEQSSQAEGSLAQQRQCSELHVFHLDHRIYSAFFPVPVMQKLKAFYHCSLNNQYNYIIPIKII